MRSDRDLPPVAQAILEDAYRRGLIVERPADMPEPTSPAAPTPFEVPAGTMPVVMMVGDAPPKIIGWAATPADVPPLLHEVADTLAVIVRAREDVTPAYGVPEGG